MESVVFHGKPRSKQNVFYTQFLSRTRQQDQVACATHTVREVHRRVVQAPHLHAQRWYQCPENQNTASSPGGPGANSSASQSHWLCKGQSW